MTSHGDHLSTQEFIDALLSPERERWTDTFTILAFSDLNDRDIVADIGCGPGFFTLPLAKALSNGKLYAMDIDEEMLEVCRQRVAETRLGNVEVTKCGEFDFPLESNSLNGAFIAFVVHHTPNPQRFLESVRSLLRPRGWCTILEWYRKETKSGPPLEMRMDPNELKEVATGAGFRYLVTRDLNGEQYMATLRNG